MRSVAVERRDASDAIQRLQSLCSAETIAASLREESEAPAAQTLKHADPAQVLRDELAMLAYVNLALRCRVAALRKRAAERGVSKEKILETLEKDVVAATSHRGDPPTDDDLSLIQEAMQRSLSVVARSGDSVGAPSQLLLRGAAFAAAAHRGTEQRVLDLHQSIGRGLLASTAFAPLRNPRVDAETQTSHSATLALHKTRGTAELLRGGDGPSRQHPIEDPALFDDRPLQAAATVLAPEAASSSDRRCRLLLSPGSLRFMFEPRGSDTLTVPLGCVTDCVLSFGHLSFASMIEARLRRSGCQKFPGFASELEAEVARGSGDWRIDTANGHLLACCANRAMSLMWFEVDPKAPAKPLDVAPQFIRKREAHLIFESLSQHTRFLRLLDSWALYARPRRLGLAMVLPPPSSSIPVGDQITYATAEQERLSRTTAAPNLAEGEMKFCAAYRVPPTVLLAVKSRLFSPFTRSIVAVEDIVKAIDFSYNDVMRILSFYQHAGWLRLHTLFQVTPGSLQ